MSSPTQPGNGAGQSQQPSGPPRSHDVPGYGPTAYLSDPQAGSSQAAAGSSERPAGKKKKHRAGKKRRNRRQSFIAPSETTDGDNMHNQRPGMLDAAVARPSQHSSFYRLGQTGNSDESLSSELLLDHREHDPLPARRPSVQQGAASSNAPRSYRATTRQRSSSNRYPANYSHNYEAPTVESDDEQVDDRTPLIPPSHRDHLRNIDDYGGPRNSPGNMFGVRHRRLSGSSSLSTRRRRLPERHNSNLTYQEESYHGEGYDVNNPPSRPTSPTLPDGPPYNDVMLGSPSRSPLRRSPSRSHDAIIDIDTTQSIPTQYRSSSEQRRRTIANRASADVCFPAEGLSEIGEEDFPSFRHDEQPRPKRRRGRPWPDLAVLEEWSHEEKEERTMEGIRAKRMNEPVMVGGRLRPQKTAWHREKDDMPFRFTYFNEEFESTIHSQTISELLQPGQSFKELFVPDPPELSDDDSDEDSSTPPQARMGRDKFATPVSGRSRSANRQPSIFSDKGDTTQTSRVASRSGDVTADTTPQEAPTPREKPKRYGDRPVWWLDVLSPTETEMRVICKTFHIHSLTMEDILVQEPREKVELFRNYYLVSYRTFEQDKDSEDHLEPVNMYFVVFREGVLSFHFSMTPHPANVRRRIRQLQDYLILSSDWISYAVIDDITDVYAPLIQDIEKEVDQIDEDILQLHGPGDSEGQTSKKKRKEKEGDYEKDASDVLESMGDDGGADMLRHVGECRKKVMGLYRLLGTKADVIKGFAKRCNEQWQVAPRSEIGLYLGDIQDHIVTMTANLSHYENLLSRAHSNYLAQINIRMNKRAEQTNDVLGQLTVLGTIVLPMNIITGLWGMNVLVPGQDVDNLWWFFGITVGLVIFGTVCFLVAKRTYKLV